MAYINFGNTWWGAKWLDALINTDYSNRLPRGKRYARNGSVQSIIFAKQNVEAKVSGSRPRPYSVNLTLKPFSKAEKDKLLNIVTDNPLYLSALLTRQLPTELLDECKQLNIKLFPDRWKDISANCSCPDWASCCKHIAAVIYLIANEIDKNPFMVF